MKFSNDWFSEAIPIFESALSKFKGKDNVTALEIGSYEGRSASWLLKNILTGENTGIICIDYFGGTINEREAGYDSEITRNQFIENMKPFEGRYQLLEGKSQDLLRKHDYGGMIDIVYVDGSHRADDTLIDLINGLHALKSGGIMLVDDYLWGRARPTHHTPKLAIDSFTEIFKDECKLIFTSNKTVVFEKL